jgi:hypothetical protein
MGMDGSLTNPGPPDGQLMTVEPKAQWKWDTTDQDDPIVLGYARGQPTKTGLTIQDLRDYVGVPLVYRGSPPRPMTDRQILQTIRWAEDWVEQETGLLLTLTWVASPPARNVFELSQQGMTTQSGMQQLGVNYDLADSAFDFFFDRSQDQGWLIQPLRYRPVRRINGHDFSAIKNYSYQYPLLDSFFRVPPTWLVEDSDFGLVRLVPSANVQLLPLFALELSFGGFSDSLPGGLGLQYTAGLQGNDYRTRFSFIPELVLAAASMTALRSIAGTVSMGVSSYQTLVDGVQYTSKYSAAGAFGEQIAQFEKRRDELLQTALTKVSGPSLLTL